MDSECHHSPVKCCAVRVLRGGDAARSPYDKPTRALFWVSPSRKLKELFDQLHNLADPAEVVRRSAAHEVDFLPPGSVLGA